MIARSPCPARTTKRSQKPPARIAHQPRIQRPRRHATSLRHTRPSGPSPRPSASNLRLGPLPRRAPSRPRPSRRATATARRQRRDRNGRQPGSRLAASPRNLAPPGRRSTDNAPDVRGPADGRACVVAPRVPRTSTTASAATRRSSANFCACSRSIGSTSSRTTSAARGPPHGRRSTPRQWRPSPSSRRRCCRAFAGTRGLASGRRLSWASSSSCSPRGRRSAPECDAATRDRCPRRSSIASPGTPTSRRSSASCRCIDRYGMRGRASGRSPRPFDRLARALLGRECLARRGHRVA